MRPLFSTLVVPKGNRYNNTKNGFIVNTTIDEKDFHYTNRIGVVTVLPKQASILEVGDEIIVHHNVFRKYWGFQGLLRTSSNDIDTGEFSVNDDQIFAYKRNDVWTAIDDWVFVKPIKKEHGLIQYDFETHVKLEGNIVFGAPEGFKTSDRVVFRPFSEYEFDIEGEILYRMHRNDLTAIL